MKLFKSNLLFSLLLGQLAFSLIGDEAGGAGNVAGEAEAEGAEGGTGESGEAEEAEGAEGGTGESGEAEEAEGTEGGNADPADAGDPAEG